MIPAPKLPAVKRAINKNIATVINLYLRVALKIGLYTRSLNHVMIESPNVLMYLNFEKSLPMVVVGFFPSLRKAFEWAKCAGRIMSASTNETASVNITTTDTSPKNSPIRPSRKRKIPKANTVVTIAETIGGITSMVPSIAACIGSLPFS